jgi:hypothetical protein
MFSAESAWRKVQKGTVHYECMKDTKRRNLDSEPA